MLAGELNRVVTIEVWEYIQNESGEPIPTEVNTWEQRAKVENRNGSQQTQDGQQIWNYDTKITVRYFNEIKSNYTVLYAGSRYTINSVSIDTEGHKSWYVLRCSKTDTSVS